MKKIDTKTWILTSVIGILTVGICTFIYKINLADTTAKVLRCLCDSFFVTGFIIFDLGLLVWCANQGAFTGLSYGFKQIFEKRRFEKQFSQRLSYGEYREKKLKKQANFLHLIVVGGALLIISIILFLFL